MVSQSLTESEAELSLNKCLVQLEGKFTNRFSEVAQSSRSTQIRGKQKGGWVPLDVLQTGIQQVVCVEGLHVGHQVLRQWKRRSRSKWALNHRQALAEIGLLLLIPRGGLLPRTPLWGICMVTVQNEDTNRHIIFFLNELKDDINILKG